MNKRSDCQEQCNNNNNKHSYSYDDDHFKYACSDNSKSEIKAGNHSTKSFTFSSNLADNGTAVTIMKLLELLMKNNCTTTQHHRNILKSDTMVLIPLLNYYVEKHYFIFPEAVASP